MNLLITGAWKYTKEQSEEIKSLGYSIIDMPSEWDALPCEPQIIDAVICNGLFLYHPIEDFSSLKVIQLTSAGFDRAPMDYIEKKGIKIFNARGVYSIPMAEFALHSALKLYKESRFFDKNQISHEWEKHRDLRELFGKTVCIVGCGNVGTECAKRFYAFGCNVIGVDISPKVEPFFNEVFLPERLHNALNKADIVVICIPLTKQTEHIINASAFEAMKKNSLIINVARGAVIDTNALIDNLKTGKIIAALDVFDEEPLSDNSPLWELENAIITPHNSFVGDGNGVRLWSVIKSNLELS